MSSYSVAQAKDNLSRLIDEVLDGKDVVITRHGKPVVELRPAARPSAPKRSTQEMLDWLRRRREALPKLKGDAVSAVREERDDWG